MFVKRKVVSLRPKYPRNKKKEWPDLDYLTLSGDFLVWGKKKKEKAKDKDRFLLKRKRRLQRWRNMLKGEILGKVTLL